MNAAVAGAAFSTLSTFIQMAVLLFAISKPTLRLMTPVLAAGGVAAAIYGLAFALRGLRSDDLPTSEPGRAFSFGAALGLGAVMAFMLIMAAALKDWLGEAGIIVGAALAGLVDTHSAAISVASLATSGKLAPQDAVLPILGAMTTNAFAKVVMALGAGAGGFALRIVPCLITAVRQLAE
jgi:uncharacterized membrane protein (DUF4010 family)